LRALLTGETEAFTIVARRELEIRAVASVLTLSPDSGLPPSPRSARVPFSRDRCHLSAGPAEGAAIGAASAVLDARSSPASRATAIALPVLQRIPMNTPTARPIAI
jgi:hypothetical protein